MSAADHNSIPADVLADIRVVADALATGDCLSPEIVQRIHKRSEKAQKELLDRYGVWEIAVDLIRKIRDEE